MKYSFGIALMLAASGCGSASSDSANTSRAADATSAVVNVQYTLDANSNADAIVVLDRDVSVGFPDKLFVIANGSGHRRAILSLGSLSCAYDSMNSSEYTRQDGTCNTFSPGEPVNVSKGDALRLSIESVDNGNYTVVQANVKGS